MKTLLTIQPNFLVITKQSVGNGHLQTNMGG